MLLKAPAQNISAPAHSALLIVLHLLPGLTLVGAFAWLGGAFGRWGLPRATALYVAGALVLVPLQLMILRWAARRFGRQVAYGFRQRLSWGQYLFYGALSVAWAILIFALIDPHVSPPLKDRLFAWMPAWFDMGRQIEGATELGRAGRILSWSLGLAIGALLIPTVEELYFRGFLLPALARFGLWAPVLNTALFAMYHFFQPWLVPTRFLATLPLYFLVWRTGSVRLAIGVHVALNLLGDSLMTLPELWQ